jgi:hypothetical protein
MRSFGDAPLQDGNPIAAAHAMCDFGSKALIMHQKQLHIPYIVNDHLLQTVRHVMAGLEVNST